jgi:ribosomal protein S18 acetylase RimI-like enzyme
VAIAVVQLTPSHEVFGQVAALFDDYRAHYGRPPSPKLTRDWLHGRLAQRQMMIAAAMHGEQACGFITTTVMPASLTLGTAWSIRDLYVVPQRRRGGIARALLQHVVEHARAAGAHRVSLQTEADNAPALGLYTAAGFRPVSGLELLSLTLTPGKPQDSAGTL